MKSKRYTIIGIVAIVSLIFFVVVTFCGKGHQWSNNVVQGFKSLGLKGNVKVIRTYKEIEAFHGTVVEVNYTERFSDGYFLDENLRADIREYIMVSIFQIFILRYLQKSKHCSMTKKKTCLILLNSTSLVSC